MIPVEVTQAPWHYTSFWDWLDHWQTLIAGVLAFAAGFGTVVAAIGAIWATRSAAKEQIDAAREQAEKMVAAAREQARATVQQTNTTFTLEQMRNESEASSFHVMLVSAMGRVFDEAALARETYPHIVQDQGGAQGESEDAYAVRQCITKGAFAELRAACVRRGGDLTFDLLDVEREIDNFASQWAMAGRHGSMEMVRKGKQAGLVKQLALIETKAGELLRKAALRDKAAERI